MDGPRAIPQGLIMPIKTRELDAVRVGSAVLGSLLAWLAFLLAGILASDRELRLFPAAPLYLLFVAGPSLVAILAGRTALTRMFVTGVMTAVAAYAAMQIVTIDDGQAGLAVLFVPYVAFPLATTVWVGGAVLAARKERRPPGPARVSDRLAALTVDVLLLGALLVVPLSVLSHGNAEIAAAAIGVVLATLYFGAFAALAGRTPGQALLGLRLVHGATGGPVPPGRALLRSFVLVLELLGSSWMLLLPVAIAELVAVVAGGRSLSDRLFGTSVVAGSS
jgi:hypothetical protein